MMLAGRNRGVREIKLSIAIPVYNGAAFLKQTIDSIVPQLDKANGQAEILISDNASTDNTAEIVDVYLKSNPMVRYCRNEENFGVDRNVDLAVQRSLGEYVWFFGDDDRMAPGGVRKVLDVIEHNPDIALIFMNCKIFSRNFKKCLKEKFLDIEKDVFLKTQKIF